MTTIIAEAGINASGDIDIAQKMMKMAKDCGADIVKFQKRTIDIVYTEAQLNEPRDSPWGRTNGDQKRGLEFSYDNYVTIDTYSKLIEMPWFASAWDVESLEFLDSFNLPANKIASAMITNCNFVEEVARRKKLTYISTGLLQTTDPIKKVVGTFIHHDCPFVLMHCVGAYPCPAEDTNLEMIKTLKSLFPFAKVGFSSHSVSPVIAAAAVLYGAEAIEAHITLDRSMYGSDQAASLEAPGLRKLVEYAEILEAAKGNGFKRMTKTEHQVAGKLRYW